MSTLFLVWHLGLGDAIICCGLVRWAIKNGGWAKIILPAKPHNVATVKWMFSDDPTVEVMEVADENDMRRKSAPYFRCCLGIWSQEGLAADGKWSEQFYRQAGVPFECRWSEFKLPWSELPKVVPYIPQFWHDDPKRNYLISGVSASAFTYRPNPDEPFQNHIRPLQSADEIHVIDSCFLCLADTITTNAKRHVLHYYATQHDWNKRTGPPTLRKNWEILR